MSEGLGMRVQAGLTMYIAKTKLVILTTCMQSGYSSYSQAVVLLCIRD